ncbi:MAG: hypothetical protein U0326_33595 [Polyangiales bacterium]
MRSLLLAITLGVVTVPTAASADLIPPPSRPRWDDPPAPLPAPPELFAAAVAMVALGALAVRRRRASVPA